MRVIFRQTGGYAGIAYGCELRSDDLSEEETAALRSLLRLGEKGSPKEPPPLARDVETYEILVEGDGPTRRFTFDGLSIPEGVGPLLDRLKQEAHPRPLT